MNLSVKPMVPFPAVGGMEKPIQDYHNGSVVHVR